MQAKSLRKSSIDELVIALCRDYERRKRLIDERLSSFRTDTEYRYLNFNMFDAAAEIAGDRYAELYIYEIGRRTGFARSAISGCSEVTYKKYKKEIINNIAKKLHLTD